MVDQAKFMRRWATPVMLVVALAVAVGLLADTAFWREPRLLTLGYVQVTTPAWPAGTAPLRVVVLSDLHVDRAHVPPERVRRLVQTVNALSPDLIVLAGDYVGGLWDESGSRLPRTRRSPLSNAVIKEGLIALGGLKARYGVAAVMGNHDGWWDAARVSSVLRGEGVTVLENASLRLRRPDGDVWVIGLEDAQSQHPDFAKAMRGVPPGTALLGVAHQPAQFDEEGRGLPILLAGHTHGGQVRFPWLGAIAHRSPYINRSFAQPVVRGGRVLVVSRGIGESGMPVRFGSPPEILVVEIAPGKQAAAERLS